MFAIVTLLVTITLSLLITRIATEALVFTGLSRQSARFQARSAFSGVGYTTSEAESVTNHPVRRRIMMVLMLLGNAGIVTVIATLMASLAATGQSGMWGRNLLLLAAGLIALTLAANSSWLDRRLSEVIGWALGKWTKLDLNDYTSLLQLARGYAVSELQVDPEDWLANKSLAKLNLPREGVLVLGVLRRDGTYVGAPTARTLILPHDTLILYGPEERHEELNHRHKDFSGALARLEAVSEQKRLLSEQEEIDVEEPAEETPAQEEAAT